MQKFSACIHAILRFTLWFAPCILSLLYIIYGFWIADCRDSIHCTVHNLSHDIPIRPSPLLLHYTDRDFSESGRWFFFLCCVIIFNAKSVFPRPIQNLKSIKMDQRFSFVIWQMWMVKEWLLLWPSSFTTKTTSKPTNMKGLFSCLTDNKLK